ncbi:saccharopine dehydrogenase NADP-binding domain-containing protein [Actinocorallia aurantiaca]|uniref:Saccharopine dehydrogenase NADP-binding domain-containing protein n=1 Tax=Actinocorallia aurantiaca TaxID=46204 RepID=A0ABN3UBG0_9ACTN
MRRSVIAVYGATGHTGRLVVEELRKRGYEPLLAGRDPGLPRPVRADDPAAVRELVREADVIVQCAGPFSKTGRVIARTAAEVGCHYVDHAVESHHVRWLFDELQETARRNGVAMVPGLSFYGGLGDLLAGAVTEGMDELDVVTIAYAVSGWRMTTGAKDTAEQLFAETERITFTDGEQRVGYVEPRNVVFPFPPPVGPRTMIAPLPSCDVVLAQRHVRARNIEAQLTAHTFTEDQVFVSEDAAPEDRARSEFMVAVQALGKNSAAGRIVGEDLWLAGVHASVEGAVRLAEGEVGAGVHSPAEAFEAEPFLRVLEGLGAFSLRLPGRA